MTESSIYCEISRTTGRLDFKLQNFKMCKKLKNGGGYNKKPDENFNLIVMDYISSLFGTWNRIVFVLTVSAVFVQLNFESNRSYFTGRFSGKIPLS